MKNKKIIIYITAIMLFLTMIFAVNIQEEKNNKINIVTSFYPVYIATLNITDGVENVNVSNLTSQTVGCIHDYVLSTSEMVKLAKADAIVINGAGMESFMEKIITNFNSISIIDSSKDIEIIQDLDCDNDHHLHEGHSHETNPHIFVSVKNYIKQVENISKEVIKLDPQNKDKYDFNTRKYIAKLNKLDKEIEEKVKLIENKKIISFHNTFEYFAKDYGFEVIGTIENEHGKTPSATEIAKLIKKIKEEKVQAIFVEPEYNLKLVETIAKETGCKIYKLNPITSGENDKEEYINIMKDNLKVLKEALS